MSCSFWNMRRRLRRQLGIEREIKEEKVIVDIATAQKTVEEKVKQTEAPKTETKTAKKGGAKKNDNTAD